MLGWSLYAHFPAVGGPEDGGIARMKKSVFEDSATMADLEDGSWVDVDDANARSRDGFRNFLSKI